MNLELTREQAVTLKEGLDTHLDRLRRILAATDGQSLQHEIRLDLDRLEEVHAKVIDLLGGAAQSEARL